MGSGPRDSIEGLDAAFFGRPSDSGILYRTGARFGLDAINLAQTRIITCAFGGDHSVSLPHPWEAAQARGPKKGWLTRRGPSRSGRWPDLVQYLAPAAASQGINLAGCDIVETNPLYDRPAKITALLAATVMGKLLAPAAAADRSTVCPSSSLITPIMQQLSLSTCPRPAPKPS